jgi:hypothetical protein
MHHKKGVQSWNGKMQNNFGKGRLVEKSLMKFEGLSLKLMKLHPILFLEAHAMLIYCTIVTPKIHFILVHKTTITQCNKQGKSNANLQWNKICKINAIFFIALASNTPCCSYLLYLKPSIYNTKTP